jgi:hypothetical protein
MANDQNLKDQGFDKNPERINRNGRPKKLALDLILADILDEKGLTNMLKSLHKSALKGNIRAAELLLDRYYGKIIQTPIPERLSEEQLSQLFLYLKRKYANVQEN